jgi:hypothetical protein
VLSSDRWFGPTTALRVRKDGVPASPWMWAKARRSKLGAVIRLCGDGVIPNVAILEVFRIDINAPLPLTEPPDRWFGPTTALRVRKDGVPASPWMWAKASSKLGPRCRGYHWRSWHGIRISLVVEVHPASGLRFFSTLHPQMRRRFRLGGAP